MVALMINAAMQRNLLLDDAHFPPVPINPASIKQALIAGATPLDHVYVFGTEPIQWSDGLDTSSIFEQGAGLVDLIASYKIMQRIQPQASLFPSYLDLTQCPYMWPFCSQPFYYSMQPVVVNVTILNSMDVSGKIVNQPIYHPYLDRNGDRLLVGFTYSDVLWPWSGFLAVHLQVAEYSSQQDSIPSARFSGLAEGFISLSVESFSKSRGKSIQTHLILPIRVQIVPTPNRSRRILFDQFHSIRYPPGFIPHDDLTKKTQQLDWLGDHIHTNMRDLYLHLRKANYFIEVLSSPYTCFNAQNYGTLLLVDPEEEFFPAEVDKLFVDVTALGLSLIVFADWYNTSVMESLRFYDTNSRRMWAPETGGSNLPALNNLLHPFGIELGDTVYAGDLRIGRRLVRYTSGTSFKRFPNHNISQFQGLGSVLRSPLVDLGSQCLAKQKSVKTPDSVVGGTIFRLTPTSSDPIPPVLGVWTPSNSSSTCGRLAVHGDSDCLSSTHLDADCFWLLDALLQFITSPTGRIPRPLVELMVPSTELSFDLLANRPERLKSSFLYQRSNVVQRDQYFAPHENGSLPLNAFQPMPSCQSVKTGLVSPLTTPLGNGSACEPQPLLLYPSAPEADRADISACHISSSDYSENFRGYFDPFSHLVIVYLGLFVLAALLSRFLRPHIRHALCRICRIFLGRFRSVRDLLCWRRRLRAQRLLYADLFQADLLDNRLHPTSLI